MAIERWWQPVEQAFIANGTAQGRIQVLDARGFYVKAQVRIISNTQPAKFLEVKRIEGTQFIYVGDPGDITHRSDVSAYLVADNAKIILYEQLIPAIKSDSIIQGVYAREPIVAIRSALVDEYGRFWGKQNPMPVELQTGSVNIGTVNAELEVQLSHKDNFLHPGDIHDSVRIGDGVDTITATATHSSVNKRALDVMTLNKLVPREFNQITIASKNSDGDPTLIHFKQSGATVATLTLTYDSDGDLIDVVRT